MNLKDIEPKFFSILTHTENTLLYVVGYLTGIANKEGTVFNFITEIAQREFPDFSPSEALAMKMKEQLMAAIYISFPPVGERTYYPDSIDEVLNKYLEAKDLDESVKKAVRSLLVCDYRTKGNLQ